MKRAFLPVLAALTALACAAGIAEAPPVDIDMTGYSDTILYSQIYDMLYDPDAYLGQTVRLTGSLDYYQDPETMQEYFTALVSDATSCCAVGLEFACAGDRVYPRDYPEPGTQVTVTGTFDTYEENGFSYARLSDAEVVW